MLVLSQAAARFGCDRGGVSPELSDRSSYHHYRHLFKQIHQMLNAISNGISVCVSKQREREGKKTSLHHTCSLLDRSLSAVVLKAAECHYHKHAGIVCSCLVLRLQHMRVTRRVNATCYVCVFSCVCTVRTLRSSQRNHRDASGLATCLGS